MRYLDTLNHRGIRASIRRGNTLWLNPQYLATPEIAEMVRSHKDELIAEIRNSVADTSDVLPEIVPDYCFLWVATDLDSFEEFDPRFGYEVNCEPVYRMLDASYYAWLRHRMENARKAHSTGRLDEAAFETLRIRFNTIHDWSIRNIGEDALRTAVRITNVKAYVPPSEQTFTAYRKTWDEAWGAYQQRQAAHRRSVAPSGQARRLERLLNTQGYAGIRTSIIEDVVVFTRDDSIAVPDKWADKVRFTMEELKLMIGSSPETVQQIYEVKRVFGGKVVPSDDQPFSDRSRTMSAVSVMPAQQSLFSAGAAACAG
jgi:hypothetical protein